MGKGSAENSFDERIAQCTNYVLQASLMLNHVIRSMHDEHNMDFSDAYLMAIENFERSVEVLRRTTMSRSVF